MINLEQFTDFIWEFYQDHARTFIWRQTNNPYEILISEIMLQQTQTSRVALIYPQFLSMFPDFLTLARAPRAHIIMAWKGLGYNRRARFVHEIANTVIRNYHGLLPDDSVILQTFPGIGKNTAGSIAAFAFGKPVIFIETNIRAVFLHHFFYGQENVSDQQILPLIAQTVSQNNPRHWYYALMDYGAFLKKQVVNPSRRSKHYIKQSKFEGSDRQIRGKILALLSEHTILSLEQLQEEIQSDVKRIDHVVRQLIHEQLISSTDQKRYQLYS